MLILTLIAAALLLTAANLIAFYSRHPVPMILGLCLVFTIGPVFLGLILTAVAILALLLLFALFLWKWNGRGPSYFRSLSLGAILIAFGISGLIASQYERGYARLRDRYPYESMEARLPVPKPSSREVPLASDAPSRLEWVEGSTWDDFRSDRLRRLHEDAVGLFVDSFGFGVARMSPYPSESNLASHRGGDAVPLQPGARSNAGLSPGEWIPQSAEDEESLGRLHEWGLLDFANAQGFGYIKDRKHVAGFESHGFSHVPMSPSRGKGWRVETLNLVGLILHDEPAVYVSERLPAMAELRGATTRPLDKFEAIGLKALQGGDDLMIVREGTTVRMLGALRSTSHCAACHGGGRGDLLGAFTYTLREEGNTRSDQTPPMRAGGF